MGVPDKLQSARYEFKYIIDEGTAEQVRIFTQSYLEPDQYTVGKEGVGYSVYSLYLDSADLLTCGAVLQGEKNRFKLRLRFYDEDPQSPVFFEVKRRINLVILKKRAAVKRSSVPHLLMGAPPAETDLHRDRDERSLEALHYFCWLRDKINARPTAYTSYRREGYEPPENNVVRVTFDRDLRAGRYEGNLSVTDHQDWDQPTVGGVVLELKFTDRFPGWLHDMVQSFNLTRTSCPKYVKCVTLLNGKQLE